MYREKRGKIQREREREKILEKTWVAMVKTPSDSHKNTVYQQQKLCPENVNIYVQTKKHAVIWFFFSLLQGISSFSHLKSLSLLVSYTFCGEQFRSWSLPQTKLRIRERERWKGREREGEESLPRETRENQSWVCGGEKKNAVKRMPNQERKREEIGTHDASSLLLSRSSFFLLQISYSLSLSLSLTFALCSRKNAHQILSHFAPQQHFGNQLLAPMNSHPFGFRTSQFLPLSLSLSFSLPLKFLWEIFSFCHWTFKPSLLSGRREGMKKGKGIKERVWKFSLVSSYLLLLLVHN